MKKIMRVFGKFHNENKGVTLVELIIAVSILSIAVAPLLYSFVFSTRFNAKSKIRQRSTAAAQTVMENFKANDIETVKDMFTGVSSTAADGTTSVTYPNPFLRNNLDTVSYSFVQDSTSTDPVVGTYTITGMILSDDSSKEKAKYDAVCTVTSGLSIDSLADVDVYNPTLDGLWQETMEGYGSYYYDPYYVATEICDAANSANNLNSKEITSIEITRNINLDITSNSCIVTYSYPCTIYYSSGVSYTPNPVFSRPAMPATVSVSNLRNIYFYYYPAYNDTYKAAASDGTSTYIVKVKEDNLILSNTSGRDDINLFIYKQINSSKTYFSLTTSENRYKLHCTSNGSTNITNLYDCIQSNLANVSNGDYDSSLSSFLVKDICTESSLVNTCSTVGPFSSGTLTYNIDIKIYKSDDVATNGLSSADVLSHMTGSVVR